MIKYLILLSFVLNTLHSMDNKESVKSMLTCISKISQNWMKHVDGNKKISDLSIPGTHDSCASYSLLGYGDCQDTHLDEQLNGGIRFLDIRACRLNDALPVYHGPIYQHMKLRDIFTICGRFLKENPSDTILLSLKEENAFLTKWTRALRYLSSLFGFTNPALSFCNAFKKELESTPNQYLPKFYRGKTIPTLDEVRGSVIIFKCEGTSRLPIGITIDNFSNGSHMNKDGVLYSIQDNYNTTLDKKKTSVIKQFETAKTCQGFSFNFISGFKYYGPETPEQFANEMNTFTKKYLESSHEQGKKRGIVAMDFFSRKNTYNIVYNLIASNI